MELVRGKSLESLIRGTHPSQQGELLATEERLRISVQVARALEHLHRRNIVHRDVKPANIFVAGDRDARASVKAKLGDFGVVKWGDFNAALATGSLTVTSQRGLGTLKYMSPEQALIPKRVTVRSDVYSLGTSLFELFTGKILGSTHHVYAIMTTRLSRNTTAGRYRDLGVKLGLGDDDLGSMILDMHLRGAEGRPPIKQVRGRLEWALDDRFGVRVPTS